jgi:hypothetical protein
MPRGPGKQCSLRSKSKRAGAARPLTNTLMITMITTNTAGPPYPLVYIEWDDSFTVSHRSNWQDAVTEAPEPVVCRSVGWLTYDGERHKVVMPHLTQPDDDSWQGCGHMTIPTAVIVRLVHLDVPLAENR